MSRRRRNQGRPSQEAPGEETEETDGVNPSGHKEVDAEAEEAEAEAVVEPSPPVEPPKPPLPHLGADAVPCIVVKPILWRGLIRKEGTALQVDGKFFERHSRLGSLTKA